MPYELQTALAEVRALLLDRTGLRRASPTLAQRAEYAALTGTWSVTPALERLLSSDTRAASGRSGAKPTVKRPES